MYLFEIIFFKIILIKKNYYIFIFIYLFFYFSTEPLALSCIPGSQFENPWFKLFSSCLTSYRIPKTNLTTLLS